MRIAISTDGDLVSAHFGGCPTLTSELISENGTMVRKEMLSNPGHAPEVIPQFLFQKDAVKCIVWWNGAGASVSSMNFEIETIVGVSGKVDDAIAQLENWTLRERQPSSQPGAGRGYGVEKDGRDRPHEE